MSLKRLQFPVDLKHTLFEPLPFVNHKRTESIYLIHPKAFQLQRRPCHVSIKHSWCWSSSALLSFVSSPLLPGPFAGTPQTYVKAGVLSGKLNPSLHILTTTSAHRWFELAGSHGWCLWPWALVPEALGGVGYVEVFVKIKQRRPCGLVCATRTTHGHTIPKNDSQRSFIAKIYTHTLKSAKQTQQRQFYPCTTEITSTQPIK